MPCAHMFQVFLKKKKKFLDYFPRQHETVGLYNVATMCLLWGTNSIFKYNLEEFHALMC